MRKYIILGTFLDIGGGQLYTQNKVRFLKKEGWIVEVYTGRKGELLLSEMKEYVDNFFAELEYLPFYTRKKRREEIISAIVGRSKAEEVIIESSKKTYALWGELIAQRMNAKHVFMNLDEEFPVYEKWYYEFLDFKHKRKELVGIGETSLERMFKSYKKIIGGQNYNLRFVCDNSIEVFESEAVNQIVPQDINIGCISRLDKEYIMPMIDEIVIFANNNISLHIALVLVGSCKNENVVMQIKSKCSSADNIHLYFMGYMSPISKKLIDIVDVFIGTAGSAIMTAASGKITIGVDTITCQPTGIVGYDVVNSTYANNVDKSRRLNTYLEYVFFKMDKNKIKKALQESRKTIKVDYMVEFEKHMKFIKDTCKEKKYFQFKNVGMKNRVIFALIRTIGLKNLVYIKKGEVMK